MDKRAALRAKLAECLDSNKIAHAYMHVLMHVYMVCQR